MAKQIAPGQRTVIAIETNGAGEFGQSLTEYRLEDEGTISPGDAIVAEVDDASVTVAALWQARIAAIKSQEGIA